ncbi:MAG: hypothetical protein ACN6QR_24155 [Pseudomonas protegens]
MADEWLEDYYYAYVAAVDAQKSFFAFREIGLEAQDVSHTIFLEYNSGKWREVGEATWDTVAMTTDRSQQMLAISEEGEIGEGYLGSTLSLSQMDPPPLMLRGISSIGEYTYLCGVSREVYVRHGSSAWQPIHVPKPTSKDSVFGFEALGGFSNDEIYAAGWKGEIWLREQGNWRQVDSPTNFKITALICASDGYCYLCGRQGTLLRGRADTWEIIDLEEFTDDFWSIAEHQGKIYLATLFEVYVLDESSLRPINWNMPKPNTCYCLSAKNGALWSVGQKDILVHDGQSWRKLA